MEPGLHECLLKCKHAHCSHATLNWDLLGNANLFCLKKKILLLEEHLIETIFCITADL